MSVTKAVQKNDQIDITITGYTSEGSGIGRLNDRPDGLAIFVPGAAVGDRLRVRIVKPASHDAFGRLEEILSPSPDRIPVDCPHYPPCGGRVFRHIDCSAECQAKWEKVRDCMTRIGGLSDPPMQPILPAPTPLRYRNKAEFPIGLDRSGKPVLGFYAPRSHRIIPCESCLLQPDVFDRIATRFLSWVEESGNPVYDETTHRGVLRHLYLRYAGSTGQVMVCVVANAGRLCDEAGLCRALTEQEPSIQSIVLNINREQTERLYQKAAELAALTGEETLLDLYCGAGTIGLSMANRVRQVIGVEIVPQAVENARQNAARNGIQNAEFLCMVAPKAAALLQQRGLSPDVIILDPPRKGCGETLCRTAAEMAPQRLVYISCDPATLARDLAVFSQLSYHPVSITPVDLFPRTRHVETVVLLSQA